MGEGMTIFSQRYCVGQTPYGVFTNLWPTALCRRDRQALGGWYFTLHLGTWRLNILG